MFREITYSDVSRAGTASEADASFVMDEDAFRGFYERNARALWAYLFRITRNRNRADDLLQEAFYRFLRADSAKFESDSHRRNSLFRIATNLAKDEWRREAAQAHCDAEVESLASGSHHAQDTERRADMERAMEQLRPRDRAILWLAYAEGASHEEIAEAVGVRPASMKLLLFRARRRLAVLLRGETGSEK